MERLKETLLKRDEKGLIPCLDSAQGCRGMGFGGWSVESVVETVSLLPLVSRTVWGRWLGGGIWPCFSLSDWETSPSLKHLYMEYEEDDDISFAKWMSSFWGHDLIYDGEKEGRGHKKYQTRLFSERRASLPVRAVYSFLCVCMHGLCINLSAISRDMDLEMCEDEHGTPCQGNWVPTGSSWLFFELSCLPGSDFRCLCNTRKLSNSKIRDNMSRNVKRV